MENLEVLIARLQERTDALESWQKTQNGALNRMADRVDKLSERFDRFQWWLAVTAGGIAVSTILLALNLILARAGK